MVSVRQPGQRAQRLQLLEEHREEVMRYQPGVGAGQAGVVQEIGDDSEVVVCQGRQDVQQRVVDRVREVSVVDCLEPLHSGWLVQGLLGPDDRSPGVRVAGQFDERRVQVRNRGQVSIAVWKGAIFTGQSEPAIGPRNQN